MQISNSICNCSVFSSHEVGGWHSMWTQDNLSLSTKIQGTYFVGQQEISWPARHPLVINIIPPSLSIYRGNGKKSRKKIKKRIECDWREDWNPLGFLWPKVQIEIGPPASLDPPSGTEWNIDSFMSGGSPPFTRSYVKWNISSIFRLATKHGVLYKLSHLNYWTYRISILLKISNRQNILHNT